MRYAREPKSGPRGIRSRGQTRKRKSLSSPAEELGSEDKAKCRSLESDVTERAAGDDGEYKRPRRRPEK